MHLKIATVLATLSVEELNNLLRHHNAIVRIRDVDVQDDCVQYIVVFAEDVDADFASNRLEPNEAYLTVRTSDGKIDVSF